MVNINNWRQRNYAAIVYPNCAPENWMQLLEEQNVQAFISPLHKQTCEKQAPAHYHVLVMFSVPKDEEQAGTLFDMIGAFDVVRVNSVRCYARYMCRLDCPEEKPLDFKAVKCLGGADYERVIK